jgi:hypothetical protein
VREGPRLGWTGALPLTYSKAEETGHRVSVGYKLYRQVANLAPEDWTSGMLVVAWIIADDANDQTRRSFITTGELCHLARMSERGVRKALEKLAENGFEFRVALSKGKDGRPVFATRWKAPEYQVPDIFQHMVRAAGIAYGLVDNPAQGGTTVPA